MPHVIRTLSLLTILATISACRRAADDPKPDPEPSVLVDPQPDRGTEVVIALSDRKIAVTDCLLRSTKASRHSTTALRSEEARLANLTDNDARTMSLLSATPDTPLELIYEFAETATPHELVVLLPERLPPGASTARVEVLGSSLSPATGYQFLRADPLETTDEVQRFRLRPQGVKWVMLRFQPMTGSQRIAVSEIALLGKWELPKSAYAFKESPVKAIELLAGLQAFEGVQVALDPDEAKLVADVNDGRFKTRSLAEAAYFAGGIRDVQKRKKYLDQIDALAEQAKNELGAIKSPMEKGDKLLTWLHDKALAKGYTADQSDLHTILDQHSFNCLSSAILYVTLAHKLGLDARGIEVPDHAFAIVYDKKDHADVETTTPRGFNPQRDAIEEFSNKTNFVYIPDSNRDKRREVRDAGLAALVYYNHGVDHLNEKRYPEALAAFFRALSLDQESAMAVQNALVALSRWGLHLSDQGRFEEALGVTAAGLNLARQDAALAYARNEIWLRYAKAELKKSGHDAALAVLSRAAQAVPDGPFRRLQAWPTIEIGEPLVEARKWDEALALIEPVLPKLDPEAQALLREWQAGIFVRWARAELKDGRFPEAIAVLERGLKLFPDDGRFPNLLGATTHQWASSTQSSDNTSDVRQAIAKLQEKYPDQPAIKSALKQAAYWRIIELQENGKHSEALAAIQPDAPLYPGEAEAQELLRVVYDNWASTFIEKKDWKGTYDVYIQALAKHPDDPHLKANFAWVVQQWLETEATPESKQALMARLKAEHPNLADHIGISATTVWDGVRSLKTAGQFRDALAALDRQKNLLKDPKEVQTMYHILFDDWARHHRDANDSATAVNIYEEGLQRFPGDRHIENNLAVVVQRWTQQLQNDGDEAQAKEILLQSVIRFPKVRDIADVARDHVPLVVQALRSDGKYDEALAALARHRDLLVELHGEDARKEEVDMARDVYHVWARPSLDKEEWDKALEIYAKGLERYGRNRDLVDASASVWDRRAKKHSDKIEWDQAIEIYDAGLKQFPDHWLLKNNRNFCIEKKQGK